MLFTRFLLLFGLLISINSLCSAKNHKKKGTNKDGSIYVYVDKGTGKISSIVTILWLREMGYKNVQMIDAQAILTSGWEKDALLFVMPGGADMPYVKKLSGDGYNKIQSFVRNGGNYLGICAGSYFGASKIKFITKNLKIVQGGRLGLYSGTASGPITKVYTHKNYSTGLPLLTNSKFYTYYNGGCYFDTKEVLNNGFKIVATALYNKSNYTAIIKGSYGKGRVLLTCIHPEYKAKWIKYLAMNKSIFNKISSTQSIADKFYKNMLTNLVA